MREIARLSGNARNTVRAILRTEGLRQAKPQHRPTKLDLYKAYLKNRYTQTGLSAVHLSAEIRGSEWKRFLAIC